jgi:hypothetical protein
MGSGLATLGMILIILGWMVQLYYAAIRRIFALSLKFVAIYIAGCVLLIIDALGKGNHWIWILNLLAAVAASLAGYFSKKARR